MVSVPHLSVFTSSTSDAKSAVLGPPSVVNRATSMPIISTPASANATDAPPRRETPSRPRGLDAQYALAPTPARFGPQQGDRPCASRQAGTRTCRRPPREPREARHRRKPSDRLFLREHSLPPPTHRASHASFRLVGRAKPRRREHRARPRSRGSAVTLLRAGALAPPRTWLTAAGAAPCARSRR